MAGLLGGVSDMLFGSAPGASFDPSVYLQQMQQIDNQIQSLYANAPQANVLGSPAFSQIQSLLAPNANGTLSNPLQAQYNAGAQTNALNASAAGAQAQSQAQSRNLAGSSIEAQGTENATMQQTLANSGLLASLYGLQNNNSNSLASLLNSGAQFDQSQNQNLLNSQAGALGQVAQGYGSIAGMGLGQNYQSGLATYQNAGNLGNSLLSAGLIYALTPGAAAGAGAAGAGGAGAAASFGAGSAADLGMTSGLGYGSLDLGLPSYGGAISGSLPALTGGAAYGMGGY